MDDIALRYGNESLLLLTAELSKALGQRVVGRLVWLVACRCKFLDPCIPPCCRLCEWHSSTLAFDVPQIPILYVTRNKHFTLTGHCYVQATSVRVQCTLQEARPASVANGVPAVGLPKGAVPNRPILEVPDWENQYRRPTARHPQSTPASLSRLRLFSGTANLVGPLAPAMS